MNGWISVHRQIQDHWLWKDKPFDRRSAWIDMLLLANHDNNKFLLGNELVEIERGSFITSELKLMDRWGWGKTKLRSFLELLQNDGMIIKKSDNKKTAITIVNYSEYQPRQTTDKPQTNHEQTTAKPRADTNNNDNNDNKVNNIYRVLDSYSANDDLRQALRDFIEMRKKAKAQMTDRAFNMLLTELDKLAATDEIKIKVLEQSIMNNWKSVYPLKQQQQKPQQKVNSFHNFDNKIGKMAETDLEEIARRKLEKFKTGG